MLEQRVVALLPAVEALPAEEADDLVWVGGVRGVVPACGSELVTLAFVLRSTGDPMVYLAMESREEPDPDQAVVEAGM